MPTHAKSGTATGGEGSRPPPAGGQVADGQRKMLTPPGPINRPTTIRTTPASTPPRISVTMPAMTRTTAMIHRTVAAPAAIASMPSERVPSTVPPSEVQDFVGGRPDCSPQSASGKPLARGSKDGRGGLVHNGCTTGRPVHVVMDRDPSESPRLAQHLVASVWPPPPAG